jgi:hypothetical protein
MYDNEDEQSYLNQSFFNTLNATTTEVPMCKVETAITLSQAVLVL